MTESQPIIINEVDHTEQLIILSTRYDEYIEILNEHQLLTRNIVELNRGLHLEEIDNTPGSYQLSESINHNLWEKIGAYMHKIPWNNLSRGWQVIKGKETEVERQLNISRNQSIHYRNQRYQLFRTNKKKLREYRMYFYQRIEILFRTFGIIITDKDFKKSLYPSTKITANNLHMRTYFMPGTNWKSLLLKVGKWWTVEKSPHAKKLWMVINNVPNYNKGKKKEFGTPDLIVFIKYSEVLEWIIQILGKNVLRNRRVEDINEFSLVN
ncbi:MAG: hypothetical protein HeimC2_35400 [Candidatus Heimdallarchaeota archaeon LC_2]|nr:MAG: hypothetical protein HeimC2_35400 [Candidatus Heimdallarchaeota archaeon LC_2]